MNDLGEKARPKAQAGKVGHFRIDAEDVGQRIDNFLLRIGKGVPKSHIYRVIRDGQVRVNKGRIDATYRLQLGDEVRIPPMRTSSVPDLAVPAAEFPVLFEDDALLIIDKPAGVAVHGGSGVSFGVIEQLRASRPQARYLELVHRLDRETSGILMLAKKRLALTQLHAAFRENKPEKRYLALVHGEWANSRQHVREPLTKYLLPDGERRVRVDPAGFPSHTVFNLRERLGEFTLLEAELLTGRTHQIRVHLAHLGFPIAGDEKYGDFALNKALARSGARPSLKRMFLHSHTLKVTHPVTLEHLSLTAPLPAACEQTLKELRDAAAI